MKNTLTQDTIQKALFLFEQRERHDDTTQFWCMTNKAIDELVVNKDSLAAHISDAIGCIDGDSSYLINKTVEFLEAIQDYDLDKIDDSLPEIVDGMVSIYTADRTAWLALHLDHLLFVDAANNEGGYNPTLNDQLGAGMYAQLYELAIEILEVLHTVK